MISRSSAPRSLLLAGAFFSVFTLTAAAQQPAAPAPAAGAAPAAAPAAGGAAGCWAAAVNVNALKNAPASNRLRGANE